MREQEKEGDIVENAEYKLQPHFLRACNSFSRGIAFFAELDTIEYTSIESVKAIYYRDVVPAYLLVRVDERQVETQFVFICVRLI